MPYRQFCVASTTSEPDALAPLRTEASAVGLICPGSATASSTTTAAAKAPKPPALAPAVRPREVREAQHPEGSCLLANTAPRDDEANKLPVVRDPAVRLRVVRLVPSPDDALTVTR